MSVEVVVPLHVSGIWIPRISDNPLEAGSLGAGLNLAMYLRARGSKGPCRITLGGVSVLKEQAKYICSETGVNVETRALSPVSLGHGFALSAALLISHSLISYLHVNRPLIKALQRAHTLEVQYGTGLGDVIAEHTGGFAVRVKPGAPGIGLAYRIIPREHVSLVVADLGIEEPTFRMLSKMNQEMYSRGNILLSEVVEKEDLRIFFEFSRIFTSMLFDYSEINGFLKRVKGVIDYYLKKSALIIWAERDFTYDIVSELRGKGIKVIPTTISPIGVTIVYTGQSPSKTKSTDKRENG